MLSNVHWTSVTVCSTLAESARGEMKPLALKGQMPICPETEHHLLKKISYPPPCRKAGIYVWYLPMIPTESCSVIKSAVQSWVSSKANSSNHKWITCNTNTQRCFIFLFWIWEGAAEEIGERESSVWILNVHVCTRARAGFMFAYVFKYREIEMRIDNSHCVGHAGGQPCCQRKKDQRFVLSSGSEKESWGEWRRQGSHLSTPLPPHSSQLSSTAWPHIRQFP